MSFQLECLKTTQSQKNVHVWKISDLLDQKVIECPQKIISKKLFLERPAKKNIRPISSSKMQTIKVSSQQSNRINFQQFRISSSFKKKNSQFLSKGSLNATKNALNINQSSPRHYHSIQQQFSLKGKDFYRTFYNIKSEKTLRNNQSQLRMRLFHSKAQNQNEDILKTPSNTNQNISQQTFKYKQSRSPSKCNFLKKGASLQKQIVVNLLKNRILKQRQKDEQKQYTTEDILSMVKVYRGFHKSQKNNSQELFSITKKSISSGAFKESISAQKKNCPINIIGNFQKSIQGWEIKPDLQILQ